MIKPCFRELLVDVLFTSVGVFALVNILYELKDNQQDGAINFATFPIIISASIVLLSGGKMLVSGWRSVKVIRRRDSESDPAPTAAGGAGRPVVGLFRFLGTIVVIFGYTYLLQKFNFFYITAALLFILFFLYGKASLWKVSLMSALGSAATYLLFVTFLNLPL